MLGVIALVAIVVVAAIAFSGGDDDDDDTSSDDDTTETTSDGSGDDEDLTAELDDVVRGYFDAYNDGDCDAMLDHIAESSYASTQTRDEAIDECKAAKDSGQFDQQIDIQDVSLVSREGDAAEVEVTALVDGEEESQPIALVREDGDWKLEV